MLRVSECWPIMTACVCWPMGLLRRITFFVRPWLWLAVTFFREREKAEEYSCDTLDHKGRRTFEWDLRERERKVIQWIRQGKCKSIFDWDLINIVSGLRLPGKQRPTRIHRKFFLVSKCNLVDGISQHVSVFIKFLSCSKTIPSHSHCSTAPTMRPQKDQKHSLFWTDEKKTVYKGADGWTDGPTDWPSHRDASTLITRK